MGDRFLSTSDICRLITIDNDGLLLTIEIIDMLRPGVRNERLHVYELGNMRQSDHFKRMFTEECDWGPTVGDTFVEELWMFVCGLD